MYIYISWCRNVSNSRVLMLIRPFQYMTLFFSFYYLDSPSSLSYDAGWTVTIQNILHFVISERQLQCRIYPALPNVALYSINLYTRYIFTLSGRGENAFIFRNTFSALCRWIKMALLLKLNITVGQNGFWKDSLFNSIREGAKGGLILSFYISLNRWLGNLRSLLQFKIYLLHIYLG